MYTTIVKNTSGQIQTWAGKEFAIDEEYVIPTDANRFKWENSSTLLAAIAVGDAEVSNGVSYFTDINAAINWLKGISTAPVDSDGAPITKQKIVPEGWAYQLRGFDVVLGNLACVTSLDAFGVAKTDFTVKHYDANDVEITTQQDLVNAVCTKIDWEPSYDYAIVGGLVFQDTDPTQDIRIGVIVAPYIPKNLGGSVEFGMGINLKHVGQTGSVAMDGRNPKILTYDATYHTSLLRVQLKYPTNTSHTFHLLFELFNPPYV